MRYDLPVFRDTLAKQIKKSSMPMKSFRVFRLHQNHPSGDNVCPVKTQNRSSSIRQDGTMEGDQVSA